MDLIARADSTSRPPVYKIVGIILAVCSGLFIGVSFVIKKIGLLKANKKYNEEAGEGYGYLRNAWWWLGMTLMIIGEICNFVAYAFVDAILVTPLGALSVVITTILSAIFLKERLSFVGKVGCFLCIIGSVVICLNAPQQSSASTIQQMQTFVISPGFLTYAGLIILGCVFIAFWAGPRYGKKSMLVYLSICSLIGGLSVVATQGLGAAIVTQISGPPPGVGNQFTQWFLYVLLIFVISTLVTEIIFLNKALNIFNAALVTPTYYVYFTSSTIVASSILFRGFKGSPIQIVTIVMGFLTICSGVVLLQLSKSAKDVPDAAVFKGDLDQMRTVAEQEEPESEPRSDAIRGAAGLIRSFSKARLRREASEAKRLREESLEPIAENEQVEWDGLRRRKTVLAPGQRSMQRAKTVHPPLGLTHFPSIDDEEGEERNHLEDSGAPGLFKRARTAIIPTHGPISGGGTFSRQSLSGRKLSPLPLSDMHSSQRTAASVTSDDMVDIYRADNLVDAKRNTAIGLTGLNHQDTSYKPASAIQWAETGSLQPGQHLPVQRGPTPPVHGAAKRQYSFQNDPSHRSLSPSGGEQAGRRVTSGSFGSGLGNIFGARRSRETSRSGVGVDLQGKTEEERLGLVNGDNNASSEGMQDFDDYDDVLPVDSRRMTETPSPDDGNLRDQTTSHRGTPGVHQQRSGLYEDDDVYDDYELGKRVSSGGDLGYARLSGYGRNNSGGGSGPSPGTGRNAYI